MKPEYCQISDTIVRLQPRGLEKHSRDGFTGAPRILDPKVDSVLYLQV